MGLRNPSLIVLFLISSLVFSAFALRSDGASKVNPLVSKEKRKTLALTDFGQISAVEIDDGYEGPYHLQFITMEPNSLFLPVLLQADMVFFVHTGRGRLGWVEEGDKGMRRLDIQPSDIYRLESGSVFYVQSHADPTREKLRIYAIFTNGINGKTPMQGTYYGAYSTISDLVLGFDKRILQVAFKVSDELMESMMRAPKPPSIVHMASKSEKDHLDWRLGIVEAIVGDSSVHDLDNSKKKTKTFSILKKKPDVENCNGWSLAVNYKDFPPLKASDIGLFMVNLTKGSMMGPHWNPKATEVAIVVHGQGMVRIVCSSDAPQCQNSSFLAKEGDVFAVPRFHPMAQMSFNNDSFVFMGFSTMAKENHPQFLVGKSSVIQTIDEDILAMSFNVPNTTIRHLKAAQDQSIILECASCAEEEEQRMEEERQKEKEEEERRKREKEAKKREEEEKERRKEEEEEREAREREKEAEEARQKAEEEKRRQEEEARKEEEAARKQEEERKEKERRQEEKARKKQEEEKKRKEEEARKEEDGRQEKQKKEEEKETKRTEAEAKKPEEKRQEKEREAEEEEVRRWQEEQEARKEGQKKDEEARRQEYEKKEEQRREQEKEEGGNGGGSHEEGEMRYLKKIWKI